MNTDCTFRIGRDHAVCQDYGVARTGEATFVILADGCSSSPDTDVGARLLVRSAERLLPEWLSAGLPGLDGPTEETQAFHRRAVRAARDHAVGLGLDERCVDATLLTLAVTPGRWAALLYGDGVLAVGTRDADGRARVHIHAVSYSGGYPDYPSYLCDAGRRAAFEALPDNRREVEAWEMTSHGARRAELGSGARGAGCYTASGPTTGVDWIAVLTDGASSFSATHPGERTTVRLPLTEVLAELLAFKSLSGVFVQRRVQRFLKECEARGWQHHDDLGVGAIGVSYNGCLRSW